MITRSFLAALLAFYLTSCANHPAITQPEVNRIQTGVTTEAQLVKIFGRPDTRTITYNGDTTIEWFRPLGPDLGSFVPFTGPIVSGRSLQVQQLTVIVDPSRRVRSFTVYDSRNARTNEKVRTSAGAERLSANKILSSPPARNGNP